MIVDCHSCGATYNISDEKVRGRRVRVRCKSCGAGIIVDGAQLVAEDATRVYAPTFEPATYADKDDQDDRDESTRVFSAPVDMRARQPSVHDESTRVFTAPTSGDWTVNVSDTDQRTMKLPEIVNDYNGGLISDDAFVWRDGMPDWLPIRKVPEIVAALDSAEATRVVSPAVAVRPALGQRPAAAQAAVTYSAPAAPPRARRTDAPPPASVEYASQPIALAAPKPPSAFVPAPVLAPAPAPGRAAPPARVREGARQRSGADLFGPSEAVGGEAALLSSSSLPLSQYDEKPIGARNESSVLFSLDTLKAGVRRGSASSAPPRMLAAAPPTAADILGMSAGGALPGMDTSAALLSAPAVEQPLATAPRSARPPVPDTPYRSKMDTTPPMSRRQASMLLIAAVLVTAVVVAGGVFFVLRSRLSSTTAEAESAAPVPTAPEMVRTATPQPAVQNPAPTPPALATAVVTPPPEPVATAAAQAAAAPAGPVAKAAAETTPNAHVEAMKAAIKANAASSNDTGASKSGKVVLAEDSPAAAPSPAPPADTPAAAPAAADDTPAEPAKPPFDTSAAKAALEAASAGAASCKQPLGPTGRGKVQVTFSPSGRATSANVIEGDFGGTPTGGCVAKVFRGAHVPAFTGDPVTVSKSFTIPE
jgi:predicted Zn finger-like uncharacterized protein